MNVLFISSEVVPFAKTGGLADVVSSLGEYLKKQGHDGRDATNAYQQNDEHHHQADVGLESRVSSCHGQSLW